MTRQFEGVRMKNIDHYWEKYTLDYSFEFTLNKYRQKNLLKILNDLKPKRVLEIGGGFNPFCESYQHFEEYTIIEPGAAPFSSIVERFSSDPAILIYNDFFENCIETLSQKNYDFIILNGVLHEVPDGGLFLNLIEKIMSLHTTVYINVPNANSMHRIIGVASGFIKSVTDKTERNLALEQIEIYTQTSLSALVYGSITDALILQAGTFFLKPFTHAQMQECIKMGIIDERVLDGLSGVSTEFPDFGAELYCLFRRQPKNE
jgi:hypothetical protein